MMTLWKKEHLQHQSSMGFATWLSRVSRVVTLVFGVSSLLAACSAKDGETPVPVYRLTPQQLAWQPYQLGQVVRFGNARTGAVRAYIVSTLTDRLVTAYCDFCIDDQPKYEEIRVQMQRTDTASANFDVLLLQLYRVRASGSDTPVLNATEGWTAHRTPSLPLDKIDSGQPLDTTQYFRVKILSGLVLGPVTYSQVLLSPNVSTGPVVPGAIVIKNLYFTKNQGIVSFEEKASGLWYRLP